MLSSLRAQEISAASEEERTQLRALLEAMHEGVVIADGAGRITMVNGAARRIANVSPTADVSTESVRSVDIRRLDMTPLPAEDRPLARALRGEAFADAELLIVRSDGEVRRILVSGTSTKDGAELALAILVFHDVTERHQLEERLGQTERLAAAGTLAAGLAHELNNPLASVMANIELVNEALRSLGVVCSPERLAELEAMLADARLGAERIRAVVGELWTFSPTADERRTVFDVRPVLDRAIRVASNEIRHRARLVQDYGAVPLVDVDDARLAQVFVNLLANAVHALPESNVASNEIRIVTATDAAGHAVVEIRDTRPTIPADLLPHVFDPFVTTTAVAVGSGAGLGLSLCYSIVRAMGGEIGASSRAGGDTAFRIVLPPSDRRAAEAPATSPKAESPSRRGTVLVVDDEPAIGITLRRVLRDYDVTVLTSADEALAMIAAGRTFDVILSDLMMPGTSGVELYEKLARTAPEQTQRMVFVSGGAFTPAARAFLERVPNELIEKPFDTKVVRALVQRFVDARETT